MTQIKQRHVQKRTDQYENLILIYFFILIILICLARCVQVTSQQEGAGSSSGHQSENT